MAQKQVRLDPDVEEIVQGVVAEYLKQEGVRLSETQAANILIRRAVEPKRKGERGRP